MCVNPISDNINKHLILPTGRPPGSPCINNHDVGKSDYYEHVPFNHNRYPDGQHGSMYMKPPVFPPRNRTHDRKHQKKKFSRSRSTKPNKLNLISPLPDFKLNSSHHLLSYDHK